MIRPILAIASLLFLFPLPSRADVGGSYIELANMFVSRQDFGATRLADKVYLGGGLVSFDPLQANFGAEVYDIATDVWTVWEPLAQARHHMAIVSVQAEIYMIGGYVATEFFPSNLTFKFDFDAADWGPATEVQNMLTRRGAYAHTAYQGKLYVFGGTAGNGFPQSQTYIYDPGTNEWTQGASRNLSVENHAAVGLGDYIYLFGGNTANSTTLDRNTRYDPVLDEFTEMAVMPTARTSLAAAPFGDKIYVFGGETPGVEVHGVNEVYDPATNTWDTAPPMILPRHGLEAIPLSDKILLIGGGQVETFGPTNRVTAFIPQTVATRKMSFGAFKAKQ